MLQYILYSTVYSTVQYCTVQSTIVWYSTVVLLYTVLYGRIRHSAVETQIDDLTIYMIRHSVVGKSKRSTQTH